MTDNQEFTSGRSGADLDRELEQLLEEAEATVVRLRRELHSRREFAAQHAEIDKLDEHMAHARVQWSEVRAFFEDVLSQLLSRESASQARSTGITAPHEGGSDRA
ncbi:hypothetical protein [Hoyosella subflava]|uniref:Uncharacterized protein n=1 Tax=Hoyosella subflava (strain DSM 45089 / JCM 17490 / NBRC 109087 / DQS3-9A1) TaxID=443218 RepID=F6EJI2_HOYSD|nr:hypothetical protein [Hoyosella subflava]AEF39031.1 hypothetical protein AS9A_0576 [Hoyosella subflava DQS3-9A1]